MIKMTKKTQQPLSTHSSWILLLVCLILSACHDVGEARPGLMVRNKLPLKDSASFLRHTRTRSDNVVTAGIRPPLLKMRVVPPSELTLPISSNRVLECEAGGNPSPTIHWLKNGKSLSSDIEEVIENEDRPEGILGLGFTRSRLYLDCLQPQDEGVYTCVADNAFERKSASSHISITHASSEGELSMSSNALTFCTTKKSYGSVARINMWTKTRLEQIGSEVRLFCRSQGDPKPSVSWTAPDGTPITSNSKTTILENGDLVIHDLSWSDMGGYQCLVSNEDGQDEIVTFVYPMMPEKS